MAELDIMCVSETVCWSGSNIFARVDPPLPTPIAVEKLSDAKINDRDRAGDRKGGKQNSGKREREVAANGPNSYIIYFYFLTIVAIMVGFFL